MSLATACGSGSGGRIGGNPSPMYVAFVGTVPGLIGGIPIDGRMENEGVTGSIPIVQGKYEITQEHKLLPGRKTGKIFPDGGLIERLTSADFTTSGVSIPIGYKQVGFDVVDDVAAYQAFLNAYFGRLARWDSKLLGMRKFLYDKGLFNYATGQWADLYYVPNAVTIQNIKYVVNEYFSLFTDGNVANGGLIIGSENPNERPKLAGGGSENHGETGYLVYVFAINGTSGITQTHEEGGPNGEYINGQLAIKDNQVWNKGDISIDTIESILGVKNESTRPYLSRDGVSNPDALRRIAKIFHNRMLGQTQAEGFRDYQIAGWHR